MAHEEPSEMLGRDGNTSKRNTQKSSLVRRKPLGEYF